MRPPTERHFQYATIPALPGTPAATAKYSTGWESGVGAWSVSGPATLSTSTAFAHGGTSSLKVTRSDSTESYASARVSVSGFTVGSYYRFGFWVYLPSAPIMATSVELDIDIFGFGFDVAPNKWTYISYVWQATSTSTTAGIAAKMGGGASGYAAYFDDFDVREVTGYREEIYLEFTDGSVTLDEGWAPYVQAEFTIPTPSEDIQALLDPENDPRITIYGGIQPLDWSAPAASASSWDVVVRATEVDPETGTTRLTVSGDEAILQEWKLMASAPDTTPRQYQSSLVSLINAKLLGPILGTSLEADSVDADVTSLDSRTNLILNPSAEVDASNWLAAGNCSIARITGQAYSGSACIQMTLTGASSGAVVPSTAAPGTINATPGTTYTFIFAVKSAATARTWQARLRFYASNGAAIGSDWNGSVISSTTSGWTRVWVTATAPVNAAKVWPIIGLVAAGVANEKHYLDAAMLVEGDGMETDGVSPVTYFDGSLAATDLYTFAWSGTAHASTSSRTPRFTRDPDSLDWPPGVSAWDFIKPLNQIGERRLFCDEQRKWHLVASDYTVDGRVTLAEGFNVKRAIQTKSRDAKADDGTPLVARGVVVKYTWINTSGQQQVQYDYAGDANGAFLVEYDRPPLGPGLAAYILSKMQDQGLTLDITALMNYAVKPGMEAVATLSGIPIQTGRVSSVKWDFGADEMQVGTKGLTETPATAWVFDAPGISWNSVPVGTDWTEDQ